MLVIGSDKIDLLRRELHREAEQIEFADMNDVGANPAWIIPAWQQFVEAHQGRRVRGIGEPIYPEREQAELVECQHHERLLNLAFDETPLFLLCPYDTQALDPDVIAEAHHSHPLIADDRGGRASRAYVGLEHACDLLEDALPEPEVSGGGQGIVRVWREPGELICEIRDDGKVDDPLVGRRRLAVGQPGGYGLWLANRLCDLVQLRTGPSGSAVRVHMRVG